MSRPWLRTDAKEFLDEGDPERVKKILSDLERWNDLSGWTRGHLKRIRRHWEALEKPQPFRVVELGCGGGGLLGALLSWGETYGIRVELVGIDRDPEGIRIAREKLGAKVQLIQGDASHTSFAEKHFHLATCTLMLHHLMPSEQKALVTEMGRIARSQYLFDLERSITGVVGWAALSTALRMSSEARHDGVISVRRGATLEEFQALVAGLPVKAERIFPSSLWTAPGRPL